MAPTLHDLLVTRSYPGRGCVLVRLAGQRCITYFLTGRSEASKNRRLSVDGDSVHALDAAGFGGDPLRHYRAARAMGTWLVVGNGDHVDPIVAALAAGDDPVSSMASVAAEPDPPIYTPRIWVGLCPGDTSATSYAGHVRRRADGGAIRCLWSLDDLNEGCGVLVTTYAGRAGRVSVSDGPTEIRCEAQAPGELLDEVWRSLASDVRVAAVLLQPDEPGSAPVVRNPG